MLARACSLPGWLCLCELCDICCAASADCLSCSRPSTGGECLLRLAACQPGSDVVAPSCVLLLQLPLLLQAIDRRERLRRLALETIDLTKDPYFMRNHLGQYECRLCLTLHNNEGNYLAHTQVRG